MSRPRRLARLPHVLVVLVAYPATIVNTAMLSTDYGLGPVFGTLLAVIQSVALIMAMFRPVPAWWLSTIVMFIGAQAAVPSALGPASIPWTAPGLVLQAGTLFLLALRVRPRVAVEALALNSLLGLSCLVLPPPMYRPNVAEGVLALVIATVVGASLRGRRVARTELVVQEELTAEERARRALLEERNRIARELHDVVAHHMSVISIQAQVAPHLVKDPSDELKANLAGIRENAVEALTELRRVLGVLRSEDALSDAVRHAPQPSLDQLDELVGKVRGAGLTVSTEITGEPRPLSPGVELSAFRIVQEALSNALRHAPGSSVRVAIGYRRDGLTIQVVNTAPTTPAPPSRGDGHGLLGMRERATMLGGELVTGPTPDGGYEVTTSLPTAHLTTPPTEHPAKPPVTPVAPAFPTTPAEDTP
ncbi:sensor histidine kinase [Streptomyces sp. NPDC088400]|uniref:sensor histidine kinase n=1 Tax=Streptomyces sp. NPDC088400 TaxID=3365861 RepID=UPI003816B81D